MEKFKWIYRKKKVKIATSCIKLKIATSFIKVRKVSRKTDQIDPGSSENLLTPEYRCESVKGHL